MQINIYELHLRRECNSTQEILTTEVLSISQIFSRTKMYFKTWSPLDNINMIINLSQHICLLYCCIELYKLDITYLKEPDIVEMVTISKGGPRFWQRSF